MSESPAPATAEPPKQSKPVLWDERIARPFVRPLARWGVTANQVTTVSLVLALGAAAMFATGIGWLAHVAAGVFMIARFIDHLDGQLARLSGKTSRFGYYYDFITGTLSYAALFTGVGIGLSAPAGAGWWWMALGIATTFLVFANTLFQWLDETRRGIEAMKYPAAGGFEMEDAIYLIGPITWLGWLMPFCVLGFVGTGAYCAWTVYQFTRKRPPP
ncbi:MAG: CDP-alcohol phosphatidyltransferase family protein [Alphaproteobacteria bacterium]